MKKVLLISIAILCSAAMHASVVKGTIGMGRYTDWDGTISTEYGLDFNNDGNLEFMLTNQGYEPEHPNALIMYDGSLNHGVLTQGADVPAGDWDKVQPLASGSSVGAASNYWGSMGDAYLVNMMNSCVMPVGQDTYVGFKIEVGSNIHYGYAKVNVSGNASSGYNVDWKEIYYETEPGKTILVGAVSLVNNVEKKHFSIYPNPTSEYIAITGVQNITKIEIYNSLGVRVREITVTNPNELYDIRDLSNGIYIVRVHQGNKSYTRQMVKK